jgi:leucyl aminopeptidase
MKRTPVTTLSLTDTSPAKLKVDALVVAVAKGDKGPVLLPGADDIDKALGGNLAATLAALGATGGVDEVTKVPGGGKLAASVVAAVGVGKQRTDKGAAHDAETLRRAAGAATRALAGCRKVALVLPTPDAQTVGAVAEGGLLGAYTFHRYRHASREDHKPGVEELQVAVANAGDKAVKAAGTRAEAVAAAVALTRDLVNTPPGDLHPPTFADAALEAAKGLGLKTEVLDEKALLKGGYGGILGVGQGSIHPPRLVRLTYRHPRAKRSVALVGKGITFDSGGLSLKPAAAMEWMKADMGGAAAVIAAMTAIARLKPTVNVVGWAPMAENMPSGTAQRPSDVLTIYGGKTVEVLNTDAEGRLILADALARASEDKPDLIIDIATLTGAQMIALGSRTAAVMSNDDAVRTAVHDAADRAGEQMWPMPLPPELRKSMDSEVADIANMGERYGGMLVAGLFLEEFVADGLRWAHLDIAGPSFNEGKPWGYTPKGGTGAGVRTLVQIVEDVADGRI